MLIGAGVGFLAGLVGVPMHIAIGSSLIIVIGAAASGAMASQKLSGITLRKILGGVDAYHWPEDGGDSINERR